MNKELKDFTIRNGCVEWYCEHGVGHYIKKINKESSLIHGCDGCCLKVPLLTDMDIKMLVEREKIDLPELIKHNGSTI